MRCAVNVEVSLSLSPPMVVLLCHLMYSFNYGIYLTDQSNRNVDAAQAYRMWTSNPQIPRCKARWNNV